MKRRLSTRHIPRGKRHQIEDREGDDPVTPDQNSTLYETHTVLIDVSDLAVSPFPLRPSDERASEVNLFRSLFARKKYGEEEQHICVALDPTCDVTKEDVLESLKNHSENEGPFSVSSIPNIRILVVDGTRRMHALRSSDVKLHYPSVHVKLYFRKDSLPFQFGDFLSVGYLLNGLRPLQTSTSCFDKVHVCLSTLRSTMSLPESSLQQNSFKTSDLDRINHVRRDLTVPNLRALTVSRAVCADIPVNLQEAYCQVAIGIYRFPTVLDIVRATLTCAQNAGRVQILHAASPDLWSARTELQATFYLYSLSNIGKHLDLSLGDVTVALKRFELLWDSVEEEFTKRGLPSEEGFALQAAHPQDEDHKEPVITRMAEWMEFLKREEMEDERIWESKLQVLMRGLRKRTEWGTYVLQETTPLSNEPSPCLLQRPSSFPGESEDMEVVADVMGLSPTNHPQAIASVDESLQSARISSLPPSKAAGEVQQARKTPKPPTGRASSRARKESLRPSTTSHDASLSGQIFTPRRSARLSRVQTRYTEASSSTDTDVQSASVNPKFIVPANRRTTDKDGFHITRKWSTGFVYNRPNPRTGGFLEVQPDSESENGGLVGTLPGTEARTRLYNDKYDTTVRFCRPWNLRTLPAPSDSIWTEKYKMPITCEDLCNRGPSGKEAFLRSLGFRPPHQCFWRLNVSEISEIRWSVFRFFTKSVQLPLDTGAWQGIGETVFRGYRRLLDAEGYIVLPDFVRRDAESDSAGAWSNMFQDVQGMYKFFDEHVPKSPAEWTGEKRVCWQRIRNDITESDEQNVSDTRWTTTPYATNTLLDSKENVRFLNARCYVEISAWLLVHFLHLEVEDYDDIQSQKPPQSISADFPPMYGTDAGSHVLCTSTECSNQIAHTDFKNPKTGRYPDVVQFPGYFIISMGHQGGKLWILKDSHRFVFLDEEAVKHMSKAIRMTLVDLPPWSSILARGDFIHAGMGHVGPAENTCVRLHDYMLREGLPFADTIDDKQHWKTKENLHSS